jgi:hypothetical protein
MIRFSLLSICLVALGCSTVRPALQPADVDINCIQKFIPELNSEWYNTSVDVVGKHLSGLLLFKKLEDQSQRIVFTNETGVKFFDFGFDSQGEFTVYQALEKINKKAVVNTFKKDFELLLMNKAKVSKAKSQQEAERLWFAFDSGKETDYIITNVECTNLIKLEKWGRKKVMTEIKLFGPSAVPDSIQIQHFNFDMTIKMRRIIR